MKNDIPEKVIVCLNDEVRGFARDAELPSRMPFEELRKGLLKLLRSKEPAYYAGCERLEISYEGVQVGDRQTLASIGAWEGSRLALYASQGNK